jgi:DNA-binding CsgD family transcriptional regulator
MVGRVTAQTRPVSEDLRAFRLWLTCSYPVLAQQFPLTPPPRGGRDELQAAPAASALLRATMLLYDVLSRNPTPHEIATTQEELQILRLSDATLEPLGTALMALVYADWIDSAEQWCKMLLGEATQRGVPAWIGVLSSVMAEIALRRGDVQATEEHAHAALTHISAEGWGVAVGSTRAALLRAMTARGNMRAAEALVNQPLPERMFDTRDGLHYQQARGRFHLALGNPHAALRDFEACSARMRDWGLDRPALVPWRTDAAEALLRLERVDEGRALAEEQLGLLEPNQLRTRGMTLRVLAVTAPPRERLDLLGQAVQALERVRDRLELAQALADLSRAHSTLGAHTSARHSMIRARQLARACKAEALVRSFSDSTEEELKRRPPAVRPPEDKPLDLVSEGTKLSDAERRVARLVARGRSNREVAGQLFITVSTVEQHLTSIYRKLNISRRTELRSLTWR